MLGLANISKPLPYTSNPLALLTIDVLLFIRLSITWPLTLGLPSIVLPLIPFPSRALDELFPSPQNLWATTHHVVLFVAQILFMIGLAVLLFIGAPAALFFAYLAAFILVNKAYCRIFLNGRPGQHYSAGKQFARNPESLGEQWVSRDPSHKGEKWVFINGVAVGSHWMRSNLTRLALTFRRPILGIHNPTYGIPFDVLECILQRTFGYPTLDIREAYATISALLYDPSITKLVLISHSQGAIETGMVLDWLFSSLPSRQVGKLEVFTFGNASNHWNCPMNGNGRVIQHVEHYANEFDFVARFGILHFRPLGDDSEDESGRESLELSSPLPTTPVTGNKPEAKMTVVADLSAKSATHRITNDLKKQSTFEIESRKQEKNRFVGRLFQRPGATGHQMNQHYLDNFFPMNSELKTVMEDDPQQFMNLTVDEDVLESDDTVVPTTHGGDGRRRSRDSEEGSGIRIRELSRLWTYRNGKTPRY